MSITARIRSPGGRRCHARYAAAFIDSTLSYRVMRLSIQENLARSERARPALAGHDTGARAEVKCPCAAPDRPPRHRTHEPARSEEHTSELQSPCNLVCRLLLAKKKKTPIRQ